MEVSNWEYWREKAQTKFDVPQWYFDLPFQQDRPVSAKSRYLEVSSKFRIKRSTLARIENGIVEGVYSDRLAKDLAFCQGNRGIYEFLLRKLGDDDRSSLFMIQQINQAHEIGLHTNKNFSDLFGIIGNYYSDKQAHKIGRRMISLLAVKDFSKISEELSNDKDAFKLGVLMSKGNDEIFPLLGDFYSKHSTENKMIVLVSSMGSSNFEQFRELFSGIEANSEQKEKLLKAAYSFAKIKCINFLEENGAKISDFGKFDKLVRGYSYNFRPVEVYQITEKLNRLSGFIHTAFTADVDLMIHAFKGNAKRIVRFINGSSFSVPLFDYCVFVLKEEADFSTLRELYFEVKSCPIRKVIFEKYSIEFKE